MTTRISESSNGTRKRPYDEASNVLTRAVNTKNVVPYDLNTEQIPSSILRSEEYKAYNQAKCTVKALLLESFQKCDCDDRVIEGLRALVEERMSDQNLERILLCMTGAMGTGTSDFISEKFPTAKGLQAKAPASTLSSALETLRAQ